MTNNKVLIQKLYCKINLNLQYYIHNIGKLKGIKQTYYHESIYLVEFINGDRIWVMKKEFQFLCI